MSALPHSSEDLQEIYRERFAGRKEYRDLVWKVLIHRFFSKWIPSSAAVLDLGCGYCEFINNVNSAKKYGMDLNPDSVWNAAPNVDVLQQDCSTRWPLTPESLDVVFTSNFFEHLSSNPQLEATIKQAWISLKPGGRLIALGPNIKYLPGAYWDFFDHYLPLTELSLSEAFRKCNFEIEEV